MFPDLTIRAPRSPRGTVFESNNWTTMLHRIRFAISNLQNILVGKDESHDAKLRLKIQLERYVLWVSPM